MLYTCNFVLLKQEIHYSKIDLIEHHKRDCYHQLLTQALSDGVITDASNLRFTVCEADYNKYSDDLQNYICRLFITEN